MFDLIAGQCGPAKLTLKICHHSFIQSIWLQYNFVFAWIFKNHNIFVICVYVYTPYVHMYFLSLDVICITSNFTFLAPLIPSTSPLPSCTFFNSRKYNHEIFIKIQVLEKITLNRLIHTYMKLVGQVKCTLCGCFQFQNTGIGSLAEAQNPDFASKRSHYYLRN